MVPKNIKVLFCIPFVIIIGYTIYLLGKYSSIPEIIPIHGYGKNTGGTGSKLFLFLPVLLNLVILLFAWRIISRPDKINYTFEIKEEDRSKTYYMVQLVLVVVSIGLTICTSCLLFSDVVYK
ncbi:hypothetical protein M2347_001049 [Chryseobacterium sp. H1D6B]|uniref:hypothetical protein n=1 Tax=Chryseobacterium sp. H1D6B TaxID=2940588 RepID=UPI0015C9E018|nr:hypothetical protein [Chryseobacterium sp. H1D6B]MDH6251322.1 hypothetical protein [Chryseobacterium sp. H1D6B]